MPRISLTRRLLRRMAFPDVKRINVHLGLKPRKSKDEMIGQIVYKSGTNLQSLVSLQGAFPLAQWNDIIIDIGGSPRKSFEAAAGEIERSLDPVFDELDGDTPIVDLRDDRAALSTLARKLGIDRNELDEMLSRTHGHTSLGTLVTRFRGTSNPVPSVTQQRGPAF